MSSDSSVWEGLGRGHRVAEARANGCSHPERRAMGILDICMGCGEIRAAGQRWAVAEPPKGYEDADRILRSVGQ